MAVPMKLRARLAAEEKDAGPRKKALSLLLAGRPGSEIAQLLQVSQSLVKK